MIMASVMKGLNEFRLVFLDLNNLNDSALINQANFEITDGQMEAIKQQHEPRNYLFKNTEHLSMQMIDINSICSLAHTLQSYLVGSFSICQNLSYLVYVEIKT